MDSIFDIVLNTRIVDKSVENGTNQLHKDKNEDPETYAFRNFCSIIRNIDWRNQSSFNNFYRLSYFADDDPKIKYQKKLDFIDYFCKNLPYEYEVWKKPVETISAFMSFIEIYDEDVKLKALFIQKSLESLFEIYKNKNNSLQALMNALEDCNRNIIYGRIGTLVESDVLKKASSDPEYRKEVEVNTNKMLTSGKNSSLNQCLRRIYRLTAKKIFGLDKEFEDVFVSIFGSFMNMLIKTGINDKSIQPGKDFIIDENLNGSSYFKGFIWATQKPAEEDISLYNYNSPFDILNMFRLSEDFDEMIAELNGDQTTIFKAEKILALLKSGLFFNEYATMFEIIGSLVYHNNFSNYDFKRIMSYDYLTGYDDMAIFDTVSTNYGNKVTNAVLDIFKAGNMFNYTIELDYTKEDAFKMKLTWDISFSRIIFNEDEKKNMIKILINKNLDNFMKSWDQTVYTSPTRKFINHAFNEIYGGNIFADDKLKPYCYAFFEQSSHSILDDFNFMGFLSKNNISISNIINKNRNLHNHFSKPNEYCYVYDEKDYILSAGLNISHRHHNSVYSDGASRSIGRLECVTDVSTHLFIKYVKDAILSLQDVKFYTALHFLMKEFYLLWVSNNLYEYNIIDEKQKQLTVDGYILFTILTDKKIFDKSNKLLLTLKMKDKLPKNTDLSYREYINRFLSKVSDINNKTFIARTDAWLGVLTKTKYAFRRDQDSNSVVLEDGNRVTFDESNKARIEVIGMKRFYDIVLVNLR